MRMAHTWNEGRGSHGSHNARPRYPRPRCNGRAGNVAGSTNDARLMKHPWVRREAHLVVRTRWPLCFGSLVPLRRNAMQSDRPSRDIDSMPGPLSEVLWSPDFVMQSIEILPVSLRQGLLWSLRPEHADSFVVGWPAGARPEEVAAQAMVYLGMEHNGLHSEIVAACQ